MARIGHKSDETRVSNKPKTVYLEWKSEKQAFQFYDKEAGQNILMDLPTKFMFLQHYHTVKGFNEASNSGVYSNEVFYIGSEPVTVRSHKGGLIAEGLYKDIKPAVEAAGGRYHRSVYGVLPGGVLINISFKGSVVKEWSDFMNDNKHLVDNQWIEVNACKQMKKGRVSYSVPEFTLGATFTQEESSLADQVAETLQAYMETYFSKDEVEEVDSII